MNEQQNTREAAINEAARSLSRLSSLGGRKKLLETLFDAGVVAGAASVDREAIVDLLTDVMNTHKHPDSFCYNECDIEPCSWCERAAAILSQYKGEGK